MMNGRRRILVLGVTAAAMLLAAFAVVRLVPWVLAEEQPKAGESDKAKGEKLEVKKIPLKEIYTTSGQEGLKWIWHRKDQPADRPVFAKQVDVLRGISVSTGAPNCFLVRGNDIAEALDATLVAFQHGVNFSAPISRDDRSKSDQMWLVAYFGVAGSAPPAWTISEVEVLPWRISVTYDTGPSETDDVREYIMWIPLGRLASGRYTLTLFDIHRREAELVRRVVVSAGGQAGGRRSERGDTDTEDRARDSAPGR
jgi:hypothetical protein